MKEKMSELELEAQAKKAGVIFPEVRFSSDPAPEKPLGRYGKIALDHLAAFHHESYVEYLMDGTLMTQMHRLEAEAQKVYRRKLEGSQEAVTPGKADRATVDWLLSQVK